jgi:hypothetical protein
MVFLGLLLTIALGVLALLGMVLKLICWPFVKRAPMPTNHVPTQTQAVEIESTVINIDANTEKAPSSTIERF